jgi:hypothetical protein
MEQYFGRVDRAGDKHSFKSWLCYQSICIFRQVTFLREAWFLCLKMEVTHLNELTYGTAPPLQPEHGNINVFSRMPHTAHIHIKLPFLWISSPKEPWERSKALKLQYDENPMAVASYSSWKIKPQNWWWDFLLTHFSSPWDFVLKPFLTLKLFNHKISSVHLFSLRGNIMSVTLFKDVSRKNSARGLTHSFS